MNGIEVIFPGQLWRLCCSRRLFGARNNGHSSATKNALEDLASVVDVLKVYANLAEVP
jgi:hypothetical protein